MPPNSCNSVTRSRMQAFLAVQASDLDSATALVARAREIATGTGIPRLTIRWVDRELRCRAQRRLPRPRRRSSPILNSAPKHIDELYSCGSAISPYFDVEQRRLDVAPSCSTSASRSCTSTICRSVASGSSVRGDDSNLLVGEWDDAAASRPCPRSAPARRWPARWPSLIRALVALRRHGLAVDDIERRVEPRLPVRRAHPACCPSLPPSPRFAWVHRRFR